MDRNMNTIIVMIRNITRKAEIINNFFKETKKCDTEKREGTQKVVCFYNNILCVQTAPKVISIKFINFQKSDE